MFDRRTWCNWKLPAVLVVLLCGSLGMNGCPQETGACCEEDGTCSVVTAAACSLLSGTYQGDNTTCEDSPCAAEEVTVFSYRGGACPSELTVKDGDPANVECGVPRSRLFDENSPLDGSMADTPDGFGTFPGMDGADDPGLLVRLDGFAADQDDPRRNIVIICLNIIIPPQAGGMRAVKCRVKRAAGFELTPEAQAVVDSGKRNYWAQQARKLAKLEADAAGGVDPQAARRADRLRRTFQRKNNTDYDALADGTRYMEELDEETRKIEITPATPGAILTIYLVFVGDAFESLSMFMPELDIIMAREPDADSPMLGDIDDTALVLESVDDLGPLAVVDYAGGVFTPGHVDLSDPADMNDQNALWITNSSGGDLQLTVPGHPGLALPADQEVAFNDLGDGGEIIGVNGAKAVLQVLTGGPAACCVEGVCSESTSDRACFDIGGTPFAGQSCNDNPCEAPVPLACCIDASCDDSSFTIEADCFNAGGLPFLNTTCAEDPCPVNTVVACCVEGVCDDNFTSESGCFDAGGTPAAPGQTCDDNPCDSDLGLWLETLGDYLLKGSCPGNGQIVTLAQDNGGLVLSGLPENEPIPLVCDEVGAFGSDVTAFGVEGHDLTINMQDTGLSLFLMQPKTQGACTANMIPQ